MMQWKSIALPHSTKESWKIGKSVSKRNLKQGDVVFFGSMWGVNHNGIYMGNNQFIHASSSKGVMYSSMDDAYWKPKYKGARRYY
jgi:murein DD-endopeptidase / murein LD-carboxypeptidase